MADILGWALLFVFVGVPALTMFFVNGAFALRDKERDAVEKAEKAEKLAAREERSSKIVDGADDPVIADELDVEAAISAKRAKFRTARVRRNSDADEVPTALEAPAFAGAPEFSGNFEPANYS